MMIKSPNSDDVNAFFASQIHINEKQKWEVEKMEENKKQLQWVDEEELEYAAALIISIFSC